MSEASMTRPRSPLELGALALAALGLAALAGLVAVFEAASVASGFTTGSGSRSRSCSRVGRSPRPWRAWRGDEPKL